jgi:hypothetical protein
MRLKLTQIVGLLLLPTFLFLSVGTAPGYAWCFGEDGHSEIEEATVAGCHDGQDKPGEAVRHDTPTLHNSEDEHCGPCLDFSLQQDEANFSKRLKKAPAIPIEITSLNGFTFAFAQSVKLVSGNLASQPPPRISQAILSHRTVVLLN